MKLTFVPHCIFVTHRFFHEQKYSAPKNAFVFQQTTGRV